MEFASLQDAFPQVENSKEKRRSKKKEGFQAYELPPTDPDRPAVKRMMEIPPVGREAFADANTENQFLDQSSQFAKKSSVNNSLPPPRSVLKLEQASSMPSFFGAEPFSNPSEDSMAVFNRNPTNSYMLDADFTKSFDEPGFGKSSGAPVPTPELRQRWKPLSVDRIDTSFTDTEKSSQFHGLSTEDINAMKSKIDMLMARLDDLENRAEGANPQLEMLSFIMTGLFLMFVLDLTVRKIK
uniref:Uncharacterized protein n=1 Tax=viral metagenome TaxID=1070528 RepID=A0A6C0DJ64_9ZZZZ